MSNSRRGLTILCLALGLTTGAVQAQAVSANSSFNGIPSALAPNPAVQAQANPLNTPAVPPANVPTNTTPNPVASALLPVNTTPTPSFAQQNQGSTPPAGQMIQPQANVPGLPNVYGTVPSNTGAPPQVPARELPPLPTSSNELPNVVSDQLGITPAQIRSLHETVDARQQAAADMINPPKSVTSSITVSLAPGSTPPVIRPFYGTTTSFLVVDSTGQPWPVENIHNGNDAMFKIDRLDGPGGSSFTIDAQQPYGQSNLILKLKGVPTPVVITLVAGQKVQDSRVEVRVEGRGPNASQPIVSQSLPQGTNSALLPVLDGIAPVGGVPLKVLGASGVQAWLTPDGRMVVRSPYRLLSPVMAAISSADGTTVYKLPATPKLLTLQNGAYVYLTVTGW